MAQALDYEKKLKSQDGSGGSEQAIEFISSLGLPREVILQFDAECLQTVIEAIAATPKKKA